MYLEIDPNDNTKIKLEGWEKRLKPLYDLVPTGKHRLTGDFWQFNLTWPVCLALKNTLKNAEYGPNLTQWITDVYNNKIVPAYNLRGQIEAEGYEDLYPHQRADVKFLALAERAILANDLGTGKSRSAFATVRHLFEQKNITFPVLIACPNSTKQEWARQVEAVWPGLSVVVVDGQLAKRRKQLQENHHVYIINWEAIKSHSRLIPYGSSSLKKCTECGGMDEKITPNKCDAHIKELNKIDFNTVIGDEIHRIKDPAALVTRAFKSATGDSKYRFGLSGTPIAAAPDDLYSILNWLFPESYRSRGNYVERYCESVSSFYGGRPTVTGIKESMKEEFFFGLDPFLRRMPKDLILQFLPPVVTQRRDVEMSAKQKKAYTQMKEQMIAEVENGDAVSVTTPLGRCIRMLQFASAYAEVDYIEAVDKETGEMYEKAKVRLSDPSCKLDAFMDDLEDFGEESVVVFAHSRQLINLLSKRMEKAGIEHGLVVGDQDSLERQMHIDNFQAGKVQFILCTIQAGGTGITLTKGSTAVFLQRSWSMIDNIQAEGRIHRIGSEQHESVRIIDYVTKDSIEELVILAVGEKSDKLEEVLRDKSLLKAYIGA